MARVSVNKPLEFEEEQWLFERLFTAFASLGNWQETEAFLMEFLTKEELKMLAKRLELFKEVAEKRQYREIIRSIKVTAQTVATAKKKIARADVYFLRVLRKLQALDKRVG